MLSLSIVFHENIFVAKVIKKAHQIGELLSNL